MLVSGAAQRLEGQLMILNYQLPSTADASADENIERGPCYRCVFPRPPAPEMVKSCGEVGILGPVVGTIGSLMASEALRLIVKGGQEERKPSMLLYNAWPADPRAMFRSVGLRGRRKDCLACGDVEVLHEKGLKKITQTDILAGGMDYVSFCGILEDAKVLENEERISANEFLNRLRSEEKVLSKQITVIDVREQYEVELGPKIKNSVNIPLSKILQGTFGMEARNGNQSVEKSKLDDILEEETTKAIYFVCPQGNDSQLAAKKLLTHLEETRNDQHAFIGDVTGGFVAIEKALKSHDRPANN